MNTRRCKIWFTEDEILAAIERAHRFAKRKLAECKELEEQAKAKFGHLEELRFELMKMPTWQERESLNNRIITVEFSAAELKQNAAKLAKDYHRTMDKTLPRLKNALAAFRTRTMSEILGEYKAVGVR